MSEQRKIIIVLKMHPIMGYQAPLSPELPIEKGEVPHNHKISVHMKNKNIMFIIRSRCPRDFISHK